MEFNRCFGCMRQKQEHPVCEHCGFDEREQNKPHQLPLGTILRGQYLIGKALGQGGFGITYLGWDLNLDMPVAIKEYYPTGVVSRDTAAGCDVIPQGGEDARMYRSSKERFMREGRALAKFEDLRNIVRIYSLFPENNTVYLVMEYAEGITLQERIESLGCLTLDRLVEILTPIMTDLQRVHQSGVIHRDISPDNIMLLHRGGAKLLDFGAVRRVENPSQESMLPTSTEAILKHGFAPTEQYTSRGALGPWTDVYALCATMCYCLNGKVPEPAPDRAISDDPDWFIRELPLTEAQKAVFAGGMALRPQDRIASVEELLRQLKNSLSEPDLPPRPVPPPRPAPSPKPAPLPRRKWPLLAACAAVVLLAGALLIRKQPAPDGDQPAAAATAVSRQQETEPQLQLPTQAEPAPLPVIPAETQAVALPTAEPVLPEPRQAVDPDLVLRNFDPTGESTYAFGTGLRKKNVRTIDFLSSLDAAPEDAKDVSENGSGRVRLWYEHIGDGMYAFYIAGDGKVYLPENCHYLFGGKKNNQEPAMDFDYLKEVNFSGAVDSSQVTDMTAMFQYSDAIRSLDFTGFDTGNVESMAYLFSGCGRLRQLNVSGFDTGSVTDMSHMFSGCGALKELDVSSFDTRNVISMNWMFGSCAGLRTLDLTGFRTDSLETRECMFRSCSPELTVLAEAEEILEAAAP